MDTYSETSPARRVPANGTPFHGGFRHDPLGLRPARRLQWHFGRGRLFVQDACEVLWPMYHFFCWLSAAPPRDDPTSHDADRPDFREHAERRAPGFRAFHAKSVVVEGSFKPLLKLPASATQTIHGRTIPVYAALALMAVGCPKCCTERLAPACKPHGNGHQKVHLPPPGAETRHGWTNSFSSSSRQTGEDLS